jgi:hypothetical protein
MKLDRNTFEHASNYLIQILDHNDFPHADHPLVVITSKPSIIEALRWLADRDDFDDETLGEIADGIIYLLGFVHLDR